MQRTLEPRREDYYFVNLKAVELEKMVLTSVEDIQKINNFCFMHKGVAQKLTLPHPFEV